MTCTPLQERIKRSVTNTGEFSDARATSADNLAQLFCGKAPTENLRMSIYQAEISGRELPKELPAVMEGLGFKPYFYNAQLDPELHKLVRLAAARNGDYCGIAYAKNGKPIPNAFIAYADNKGVLPMMADEYLKTRARRRLFD